MKCKSISQLAKDHKESGLVVLIRSGKFAGMRKEGGECKAIPTPSPPFQSIRL